MFCVYLQVTHGPFLLHCVPCGSTWMFFFLLPLSCTCVPSPWTDTWPYATPSDTIGQTPVLEPGQRSLRSGLSLRVTDASIVTLLCKVLQQKRKGWLMSHVSNLMITYCSINHWLWCPCLCIEALYSNQEQCTVFRHYWICVLEFESLLWLYKSWVISSHSCHSPKERHQIIE